MKFLDILGAGNTSGQISIETLDTWRRADLAFTLVSHPALLDQVRNAARAAVDTEAALTTPQEVDLYTFGDPTHNPGRAYERMVETVFDASRPWQRGVLLTDGNPLLFNTPVRQILHRARQLGWKTRCHAAVSCIDNLIVDLHLCVEEDGLQIVDAMRVLLDHTPINPSLGCMILQPSGVGPQGLGRVSSPPASAYEPLREKLRSLYPGGHPFIIVRSAADLESDTIIMASSVDEFPQFAPLIHPSCSAYLPPYRAAEMPQGVSSDPDRSSHESREEDRHRRR